MPNFDLGDYGAEIILDDRKFNSKMEKAEKTTEEFLNTFDKGTNKSRKNLDKFSKELNGISTAMDKIKSSAKVATLAVTAMMTTGVGFGVKFNAEIEKSIKSYEILLNSTEKATKMIKDLQNFAANSPFTFQGLDQSTKTLLGMGFEAERIIPTLQSIGNAVSAAGGNSDTLQGIALALGQIQTKGKLSAEEMNQLAERAIPAWDILSDKMNMSTQELMELGAQGKLLSDDVLPALLQGLDERFSGAMEAQSNSFLGLVNNIKETVKQNLGSFTIPLFESMKVDIKSLSDTLKQFREDGTLQEWGQKTGQNLKEAYGIVKDVGGTFISVAKGIKDNWGLISPILVGTVTALASMKIIGTVAALWTLYKNSAFAATVAQKGLNVALRANPIGLVITAIGLLAAGIFSLYKAWNKNLGGIQEKTHAVVESIVSFLSVLWNYTKTGFKNMEKAIVSTLQFIMAKVEPVVDLIGKIAPGFADGMEKVQEKLRERKNKISEDLDDLSEDTSKALEKLAAAGKSVKDEFSSWETPKVEDTKNAVEELTVKSTELEEQIKVASQSMDDFGDIAEDTSSKVSAFDAAMSKLNYKVDMGELNNTQQLAALKMIRDQYAQTIDDIRKINVDIKRKEEEIFKEAFESSKKWIDERKYYNELSLKEELDAWERIQARYQKGTEQRREADREVYRVNNELREQQFQNSLDWIEREKYYKRLSLEEELAAFQRVYDRYEEGSEERKKAERELFRVEHELHKQREDMYQRQLELREEIISVQNQLKDHIGTITDEILSIYKQYYEARKKGETEAIDQRIKALDEQIKEERKAHDVRIKQLDDEIQKYDEMYNAQIEQIDKTAAEEDYNRQLEHLNEEKLAIQKQYNVARLNDSIENKKRLEELEQQLADKQAEIADFVSAHDIEKRKQQLREAKEAQKEELNGEKSSLEIAQELSEQQKEKEIEKLNVLRAERIQYYDELIENERNFNDIREQIMQGNFDAVLSDFANFKTELTANSEDIGKNLSGNITDKINDMSGQLSKASALMAGHWQDIGQSLEDNFISKLEELLKKLNKLDTKSKSLKDFFFKDGGIIDPLTPDDPRNDVPFDPPIPDDHDWGAGGEIDIPLPSPSNPPSSGGVIAKTKSPTSNYIRMRGIDGETYYVSPAGVNFYKNKGYEKFHDGGWVGKIKDSLLSLKKDEVPAILQKGEFVLSRAAISNLGDFSNSLKALDRNSITNNRSRTNQNITINPIMNFHVKEAIDLNDRRLLEKTTDHFFETIYNGLSNKGLTLR